MLNNVYLLPRPEGTLRGLEPIDAVAIARKVYPYEGTVLFFESINANIMHSIKYTKGSLKSKNVIAPKKSQVLKHIAKSLLAYRNIVILFEDNNEFIRDVIDEIQSRSESASANIIIDELLYYSTIPEMRGVIQMDRTHTNNISINCLLDRTNLQCVVVAGELYAIKFDNETGATKVKKVKNILQLFELLFNDGRIIKDASKTRIELYDNNFLEFSMEDKRFLGVHKGDSPIANMDQIIRHYRAQQDLDLQNIGKRLEASGLAGDELQEVLEEETYLRLVTFNPLSQSQRHEIKRNIKQDMNIKYGKHHDNVSTENIKITDDGNGITKDIFADGIQSRPIDGITDEEFRKSLEKYKNDKTAFGRLVKAIRSSLIDIDKAIQLTSIKIVNRIISGDPGDLLVDEIIKAYNNVNDYIKSNTK